VVNRKGYERLSACGLDEVRFAFAASETMNQRNAGRGVSQSLSEAELVIDAAHADGLRASITVGAAFGCPFEGRVDFVRVADVVRRLSTRGADDIMLADTIGVAVPSQVRHLVREARRSTSRIGVHLHNTRNTGIANAYAALEEGVEVIDASVGGIGGCPFAPKATGNICTEDLLYMLEGEGIHSGIDLDRLIETSAWLEGVLDHVLPGQLYRAGPFPVPASA
jgi:hydroxymethylglutaryl-CoA lyase/(R)-citramalyl-CoA lyase